VVTTSGQPPNESTRTDQIPVYGQLSGSQLTLSFGFQNKEFGSISGDSFVINAPDSSGALVPVTFRAATVAQYNRALGVLNRNIATANQTEANAEALQQEQQKISADASTVSNDIAGLSQADAGAIADAKAITSTLQGESKDLAATHSAAQQVEAEGPGVGTCGDAEGVAGDAEGVGGDAEGVGGDGEGVTSDINSIHREISGLQQDFAALQADESNLPGYTPANTPSQKDVNTAVANANSAIASAISTTNGYIGQANADVSTAFGYVANAFAAGSCGAPPTAPSPIPPLSS
jgi:hypothetical protein